MSPRIMVVEDDDLIRDSLVEVLEDQGYEVLSASNGRQAFELLQTAPLPALILLDLMMPVLDGRGFRELQQGDPRLAGIPVVVLTAYREIDTEGMSAAAMLRKPVALKTLLETVRRYCAAA